MYDDKTRTRNHTHAHIYRIQMCNLYDNLVVLNIWVRRRRRQQQSGT